MRGRATCYLEGECTCALLTATACDLTRKRLVERKRQVKTMRVFLLHFYRKHKCTVNAWHSMGCYLVENQHASDRAPERSHWNHNKNNLKQLWVTKHLNGRKINDGHKKKEEETTGHRWFTCTCTCHQRSRLIYSLTRTEVRRKRGKRSKETRVKDKKRRFTCFTCTVVQMSLCPVGRMKYYYSWPSIIYTVFYCDVFYLLYIFFFLSLTHSLWDVYQLFLSVSSSDSLLFNSCFFSCFFFLVSFLRFHLITRTKYSES